MGCYNIKCPISGLPITEGTKIVSFYLSSNDVGYKVYPFPIHGEYNGYGGIENISNDISLLSIDDSAMVMSIRYDIWNVVIRMDEYRNIAIEEFNNAYAFFLRCIEKFPDYPDNRHFSDMIHASFKYDTDTLHMYLTHTTDYIKNNIIDTLTLQYILSVVGSFFEPNIELPQSIDIELFSIINHIGRKVLDE